MDKLKTLRHDNTEELADKLGEELLAYLNSSLKTQAHQLAAKMARSQGYMNKAEACKYCGITNNTFDKWLALGLQRIHIDGIIRFDKQDLDSFMKEHKRII